MTTHTPGKGSVRRQKKSLSLLPESPDHVILTFTVRKESRQTWGLTIVGGVDTVSGSVFVKAISNNSVCAIDGQIRIGDNILEVNRESLAHKTHEEVVQVFRECKSTLNVVVSRLVSNKVKTNSPVLCSYQSSVKCKYRGATSMDEESVVMEHKPLPVT